VTEIRANYGRLYTRLNLITPDLYTDQPIQMKKGVYGLVLLAIVGFRPLPRLFLAAAQIGTQRGSLTLFFVFSPIF
tara:strand:+ start:3426 stop:3653 length:228 start_codon:yes stop_codon:yes gene_type:complete